MLMQPEQSQQMSLFSVSVHYHCLCWVPAVSTKLVLLVSSGGRKRGKSFELPKSYSMGHIVVLSGH